MEAIRNYILAKALKIRGLHGQDVSDGYGLGDSLLDGLEAAVQKMAQRKSWVFDGLFYSPDGSGESVSLEESLPATLSFTFRYTTAEGEGGTYGWYVHVFNEHIEDLGTYVRAFEQIEGQVCFSDLGDNLHNPRRTTVAIIMAGTPTHSFNYDCWSFVDPATGLRYATEHGNPARWEYWIRPAQAEAKMLVYCDATEAWVKATAARLGLSTLHVDHVRDWEENR
jgi:hypothetical protein